MGVMIPIVPQEVPVEKAMKPATTITSAGRTAAGTVPTVASATYWPVPSAEMTSPIPHASTRIDTAVSMIPNPSTVYSVASPNPKIR